jgi:hypothetical protein
MSETAREIYFAIFIPLLVGAIWLFFRVGRWTERKLADDGSCYPKSSERIISLLSVIFGLFCSDLLYFGVTKHSPSLLLMGTGAVVWTGFGIHLFVKASARYEWDEQEIRRITFLREMRLRWADIVRCEYHNTAGDRKLVCRLGDRLGHCMSIDLKTLNNYQTLDRAIEENIAKNRI